MNTTSFSVLFQAIATAVAIATPAIAFGAFYWGSLRPKARNLWVIEFATKRLAFRDQFLKVAAMAADSAGDKLPGDKYQRAKDKAYDAILAVADHADRELKSLSWNERVTQPMRKEGRFFVFKPDLPLSISDKIGWYSLLILVVVLIVLSLLFYVLFLYFIFSSPRQPGDYIYALLAVASCYAAAWLYSWLRYTTEKLKYPHPRPEGPVLDRI